MPKNPSPESELAITPREREIKADAARPFDAIRAAQDLIKNARYGSLATLDPNGFPYVVTTNLILGTTGHIEFFAAGLTLQARNIARNPRISIALSEPDAPDMLTTH